jgi:hypothetical protein
MSVMQLVMQRFRLYSGTWFRFRINVRLVLDETEARLLERYTLRNVVLTEGRMRRDLIRAVLITIPIFIIFALILAITMAVLRLIALWLPLGILISFLFITFYLVYMQIREVVIVDDLLVGRDFKARSLIALLIKENQIRKMSHVFALILEQAKTWHEPEVVDLTPEPLLSVLEDENAVAG